LEIIEGRVGGKLLDLSFVSSFRVLGITLFSGVLVSIDHSVLRRDGPAGVPD